MGKFAHIIQLGERDKRKGTDKRRPNVKERYLPYFSDRNVDDLVKASLKFQGSCGDSVSLEMNETTYLAEVYDIGFSTVISRDAEGIHTVIDEEGRVADYPAVGVDDILTRLKKIDSETDWQNYARVGAYQRSRGKPNDLVVIHNRELYKGWSPENVMEQLSCSDKYLRPYSEQEMPVQEDFVNLEDFLEASRKYRARSTGTDKISKRMFGKAGFGATANKFPIQGLTDVVHVGSGSYGALSAIGNQCVFIDPALNGLATQDLNMGLCVDMFVISDVAVANVSETGMGKMGPLSEFFQEIKTGVAKFRIDDVPDGWRIFSKSRPHNLEVVCARGFSFPETSVTLDDILVSNERRNLVHQGIYTFPPREGVPARAYVPGEVAQQEWDTYDSHSLDMVLSHLQHQQKCVAFSPGESSWASCIKMIDLKTKGTDGTPPDPTLHMPARGMNVICGADCLEDLFARLPYCGVNQAEAINLVRLYLFMRLSKKGTDYKWVMGGATRGLRRNKKGRVGVAKIDELYIGHLLLTGVIEYLG